MLAVALASGGLAALLALRYLQNQAAPLAAQPIKSNMVVAARPLPIGTLVSERDVKAIEWSGGALPLGYLGTVEAVVGRGLISTVQENEPLLESKLAAKGAGGGLPVIISEGMRALTMRVNEVSGVAGFVAPNTRVDVLLTMENENTAGEPATRIIMQDVRALAAGQSLQPDKEGKPQPVPVVTFLLTPEQAETLALASQQGSIQLALRNQLDTMEVKTTGTRKSALMGGPVGRRVARRGGPTRAAVATPQPSQQVVEVYRG
ncbi:MAG: Flp pilus assembly protein CpaB, partial [Gemmatimonadales bacterium]|nr:Flp pilus assembly protein CpaB [Gemmatimonadales bacterium]